MYCAYLDCLLYEPDDGVVVECCDNCCHCEIFQGGNEE